MKFLKSIMDGLNIYTLSIMEDNFKKIDQVIAAVDQLVAEGQLTDEQYANLITIINGMLKSGEVSVYDINKNKGKLDGTYFSSDFLNYLNYGTIDATNVLPGSITGEEVARSSISEDKTTFIQVSTNLLNKDDVKSNRNLDTSNGEEVSSSTASIFAKEYNVYPGEQYIASSLYARCFYRIDGQFLSGNVGNGTFTVPDNARIMKVSTTDLDNAKLNRGTENLPYEPYYYEVTEELNPLKPDVIGNIHLKEKSVGKKNVNFIEESSNLIDGDNLIEGYSVGPTTGELVPNGTVDTSDLIEARPNMDYTGNMARSTEYDAEGNFITSSSYTGISNGNTFRTSLRTRFLRATYRTVERGIQQLNEGTELLPYEPYYAKLKGVQVEGGSAYSNTEQRYLFDHPFTEVYTDSYQYPDYSNLGTTSAADIYAMFDEFMGEYPQYITKTELGLPSGDANATTISYYKFTPKVPEHTRNTERSKIFIVCGTHGNEHITPAIVYHALKNLCAQWGSNTSLENLRFNTEFIVIPVLNTSGWDKHERVNANGIDLNRNFPGDKWTEGDPTSSTWGGTEPGSENETQYVMQIMQENPDIDVLIDFHNYHGTSATETFLWLVSGREKEQSIAQNLLRLMTRKWRTQYLFIPDAPDYFVGTTSGQDGGLMATYGEERGKTLSLTYEQCWRWHLDPNSENYDVNAIKTGIEAFLNFLILCGRYISR